MEYTSRAALMLVADASRDEEPSEGEATVSAVPGEVEAMTEDAPTVSVDSQTGAGSGPPPVSTSKTG